MTTTNETTATRPPVMAYITGSTCGDSCWHAIEDICHCSCGGRNHGCLRDANGKQPVRCARIGGAMRKLAAVGWHDELMPIAKEAHKEPRDTHTVYDYEGKPHVYRYFYRESDDDAPVRLKAATVSQIQKWPELAAYRDELTKPSYQQRRPYLAWVQETV